MKTEIKYSRIPALASSMILIVYLIGSGSCKKESETGTSFKIECPDTDSSGLLPKTYTCDGEGVSMPLEWSGYPSGTVCFAVIMHHVASPTDVHWYLVLYNIPLSVNRLEKSTTGTGIFGTNSVNNRNEYAPPCSQGPGRKDYIITVYAMSEFIYPQIPVGEVDREALLNAMEGKIISSTSTTVWYSRDL